MGSVIALLVLTSLLVYFVAQRTNRSMAARSPIGGRAVASFAPSAPSSGRRFAVEVVGESFYLSEFEAVLGPRTEDGVDLEMTAVLRREPQNPHDPYAVAVELAGRKVGHLSRRDARTYGPSIESLEREGSMATCAARVRGGWDRGEDDNGFFGVWLDLPAPPRSSEQTEKRVVGGLAPALVRARTLKSREARQKMIEEVLPTLGPDEQTELLREIGRVEVQEVLSHVRSLKTTAAKRRHLNAALAKLQSDPVPDDLQTAEIGVLKEALLALDARPRAEA